MYELPTSVFVNDREYKIRNAGDFRMVLDCFSALNDIELGEDYRILASLLIFYEDFDDEDDIPKDSEIVTELIKEMFKFFNSGHEETRSASKSKLVDWEKDDQIIMSAINNVAGKEVRLETFVHWWTFLGYYMAIGESVLSTVVAIRDKILRGKKLEKWENEFRTNNPDYFIWNSKSIEEQELDKLMYELWNSGE